MGRFYGSGFHAKFTDQVYMQTLLVLFTGLVYLLSFVLPFKPSLRIKFTYPVLQVKGFSQVYELSFSVLIGSYFTGSKFMSILQVIFSIRVHPRI